MNNLLEKIQKICIFLLFIEFLGEKYSFQSYWRMNYTARGLLNILVGPHFLKPGLDHKPSYCKRRNSNGTRFKFAAVGPLKFPCDGLQQKVSFFFFNVVFHLLCHLLKNLKQ